MNRPFFKSLNGLNFIKWKWFRLLAQWLTHIFGLGDAVWEAGVRGIESRTKPNFFMLPKVEKRLRVSLFLNYLNRSPLQFFAQAKRFASIEDNSVPSICIFRTLIFKTLSGRRFGLFFDQFHEIIFKIYVKWKQGQYFKRLQFFHRKLNLLCCKWLPQLFGGALLSILAYIYNATNVGFKSDSLFAFFRDKVDICSNGITNEQTNLCVLN